MPRELMDRAMPQCDATPLDCASRASALVMTGESKHFRRRRPRPGRAVRAVNRVLEVLERQHVVFTDNGVQLTKKPRR
jgi:hypothetical protein